MKPMTALTSILQIATLLKIEKTVLALTMLNAVTTTMATSGAVLTLITLVA